MPAARGLAEAFRHGLENTILYRRRAHRGRSHHRKNGVRRGRPAPSQVDVENGRNRDISQGPINGGETAET
jgi:hypothetical protein